MGRLLELSTAILDDVGTIAIDGTDYGVRPLNSLPLKDHLQVQAFWKTYTAALERVERDGIVDEVAVERLNHQGHFLLRALLPDLPDEVITRLTGLQQARILGTAMQAQPEETPGPFGSTPNSSPDSPASSAVALVHGSPAPGGS